MWDALAQARVRPDGDTRSSVQFSMVSPAWGHNCENTPPEVSNASHRRSSQHPSQYEYKRQERGERGYGDWSSEGMYEDMDTYSPVCTKPSCDSPSRYSPVRRIIETELRLTPLRDRLGPLVERRSYANAVNHRERTPDPLQKKPACTYGWGALCLAGECSVISD